MGRIATIGDYDLIYSADDMGFYWQRLTDHKTSQLFATKQGAYRAYDKKTLKWS